MNEPLEMEWLWRNGDFYIMRNGRRDRPRPGESPAGIYERGDWVPMAEIDLRCKILKARMDFNYA